MKKILALLLFAVSAPLLAAQKADSSFEYGGIPRDYGVDLIANHRNGALSIAVLAKEVRPGQVDDNGVLVVADNRILQFSVMKAGSRSGKTVSEMDPHQILEAHRQSRVSFLETLTHKHVANEPGVFHTVAGREFYFWHVDTGPRPGHGKASLNKVWRHLHATTTAGDLVAILIVPLMPTDDENAARDWLTKTAATLTAHSKPFVRAEEKNTAADTAVSATAATSTAVPDTAATDTAK
jgi:hypothetical protein